MDARKFSGEWILPVFLGVDILVPDMFLIKKVIF
jgi:hypothetical protein